MRSVARVLLLAAATSFIPACRNSAPAPAEASEPGMSPSEVVLAVNRARASGRFDGITRSLAPDSTGDPVAVILALDQVLAANAALQRSISDRYGPATAADFDLSDMGNSFGVFSVRVRVVKEVVRDAAATVTIQEGDNVPLREVPLTLHNGRWLIHADAAEPGLVERLQKLARTLDQMRAILEKPDSRFEDLSAAFRLQIWPQLQSIAGP